MLAHRGLSLEAPENSLLAFAHALAQGTRFIETDARATADGVAVLCHDETLERMTGDPRRVAQFTWNELSRVALGHGQHLCSLAEALHAFPDAHFNIDVKSADAALPVVTAVEAASARDRVLVTSFSERRRRAAVRRLPGVATSASSPRLLIAVFGAVLGLRPVVRLALHGIHAVQAPQRVWVLRVTTPRVIRAFHAVGVEVHIWTINTPERMSRLLDLGVDGIVTDRSDLAMQLLRSRNQ